MARSQEKLVSLTVIATTRHCSNDCAGMSNDAQRCHFFEEPLTWDPKRLINGNKRLSACKKAELAHPW